MEYNKELDLLVVPGSVLVYSAVIGCNVSNWIGMQKLLSSGRTWSVVMLIFSKMS